MREILGLKIRPIRKYPATDTAPARARISPKIELGSEFVKLNEQANKLLVIHESLSEISITPINAIKIPKNAKLFNFSCSKNTDNNATHKGPVETRTTELAILV